MMPETEFLRGFKGSKDYPTLTPAPYTFSPPLKSPIHLFHVMCDSRGTLLAVA